MLDEVGGTEYLVKLTRFSGSTKQAIDYAKIIQEMFLKEELVLISDNFLLIHSMLATINKTRRTL